MRGSPAVAVIGGGIQGCCLALALAERGVAVDLIEGASRIMDGASRFNEGKIHLGYTYAADASLETARRQARGAASFSSLLRQWLGPAFDSVPVSPAVRYGVHAASQFGPEELGRRYEAISDVVLREFKDSGGDYLGATDPVDVAHVAPDRLDGVDPDRVIATFSTGERSLEPTALADAVAAAVHRSRLINVRVAHRVDGVAVTEAGLRVRARSGEWQGDYDVVANASWNGRLALDRSVGLDLPQSWNFRVKHFLRVRTDRDVVGLPTMTLVLGPFGDVVPYTPRDLYLSWYPVGRTAWTQDVHPSPDLLRLDEQGQARVAAGILEALAEIFPALRGIDPSAVDTTLGGGFIYAEGGTDLDDPGTALHRRSDEIRSLGGYHTLNPGKLGCAPALAVAAATRIAGT